MQGGLEAKVIVDENIIVIDVKDGGRLQIFNINIARWRLLEILFLYF
jgi:hypothetical protein